MGETVKIAVVRSGDSIDMIFGGGKEFDKPGEYAITISRDALQPFINTLQRFADSTNTVVESYFDVPEGMVDAYADDWQEDAETERPDISFTGAAIAKRLNGGKNE